MDEIFDRIKATKIKRKYLILGLISTQLFGILVLIWFLRVPLSQKFLFVGPKAYSVISLSPQKRYLISQGDHLRGKAIPNTQVRFLITPDMIKGAVSSDSEGNWTYPVPDNLPTSVHRISFGNFDRNQKLATFQSYKFRVESNVSFFKFTDSIKRRLAQNLGFKEVFAQNNGLSANYYSNLGLPNPTSPVELTEDEKYRLKNYFLPDAYPAAEMAGADLRLMAMWILNENYVTNFMDNCLDGNKEWGDDADLNQNTTCTGWTHNGAPNWQVGWGIFPYQWVDRMPEAVAITHPGESIQQIGQRVIDESKSPERYPTRGNLPFKEPSDPITNPEIFPDNVTLEQIIEGSKPVGDGEQTKPCPRTATDQKNFRTNQDPKDCEMRQLLGILMKDSAISTYFLALMWNDIESKGSLEATFRNWGPEYTNGKYTNPYANIQKVSNTIAAMNEVIAGIDLTAYSAPRITIPVAVQIQSASTNFSPVIQVDAVESRGGIRKTDDGKNKKIIAVIPKGTNPHDLASDIFSADFEYQPGPGKDNVKGINISSAGNLMVLPGGDNCDPGCAVELNDPQIAAYPQDYDLCALLQPWDYDDAIISSDCINLALIIDPQAQAPIDLTANQIEPAEEGLPDFLKAIDEPISENNQVTICPDPDWSDKETSGDFICRGNQACYKAWQAKPGNSCEAEETGELCEYDFRCAEILEASGEETAIEPSLDSPGSPKDPLPEPENIDSEWIE